MYSWIKSATRVRVPNYRRHKRALTYGIRVFIFCTILWYCTSHYNDFVDYAESSKSHKAAPVQAGASRHLLSMAWEGCEFETAHLEEGWVVFHALCILILFMDENSDHLWLWWMALTVLMHPCRSFCFLLKQYACRFVLHSFNGMAIICDDFFVPSLEVISERLELSEDVAGATFMAAGSSAPELFTSVVGMISGSDVGIGTIVGSAVFNILIIVAMSAALAGQVLHLDWRPLIRDSFFYGMSIVIFIVFCWDTVIYWYEASIMLLLYIIYIVLMKFNPRLMEFMSTWLLCCSTSVVPVDAETGISANGNVEGGQAPTGNVIDVPSDTVPKTATDRKFSTISAMSNGSQKHIFHHVKHGEFTGHLRRPSYNDTLIGDRSMFLHSREGKRSSLAVPENMQSTSNSEADADWLRAEARRNSDNLRLHEADRIVRQNSKEIPDDPSPTGSPSPIISVPNGMAVLPPINWRSPEGGNGRAEENRMYDNAALELEGDIELNNLPPPVMFAAETPAPTRGSPEPPVDARNTLNCPDSDQNLYNVNATLSPGYESASPSTIVSNVSPDQLQYLFDLSHSSPDQLPLSYSPPGSQGSDNEPVADLVVIGGYNNKDSSNDHYDPLKGNRRRSTAVALMHDLNMASLQSNVINAPPTHRDSTQHDNTNVPNQPEQDTPPAAPEEEEAEETINCCPCLPCCPPVNGGFPSREEAKEKGGCLPWIKYILRWVLFCVSFPFMLLFTWTIPDCSKEHLKKYYILSFAVSIFWIAVLSFGIVTLVARIGCILNIDAFTMGLVIIAVGTSVPDALSSILVARDGFGDMAVSNAIGSNVFDINLGLGLPFLIRILITQEPIALLDPVEDSRLIGMIAAGTAIVPHAKFGFILLFLLFLILLIFFFSGFKMGKCLGVSFVCLYVSFLIYAFINEFVCNDMC